MNKDLDSSTTLEHVRVRILPDGRMNRENAARYLGAKPKTLAMWEMTGKGPRSVKVGGRRFYFKDELDAFIRGETALQLPNSKDSGWAENTVLPSSLKMPT